MRIGQAYKFEGSTVTVRITEIYRRRFTKYVKFVTVYNGQDCSGEREVLLSYAKKSWTKA
jgi:hypothetical protein